MQKLLCNSLCKALLAWAVQRMSMRIIHKGGSGNVKVLTSKLFASALDHKGIILYEHEEEYRLQKSIADQGYRA